jgi:hypothetical protein
VYPKQGPDDYRPEDYLLVNIDSGAIPDVECNVLGLDQFLPPEAYDVVIFENVDVSVAFSKEAIRAAFNILKRGGELISSSFPSFCLTETAGQVYCQCPRQRFIIFQ